MTAPDPHPRRSGLADLFVGRPILAIVVNLLILIAGLAALAAVEGDLAAVAMMRDAFDRRRKNMHAMLDGMDGVECLKPEGAFYAFPSFEGILGRTIRGTTIDSTLTLADVVLEQAKVAFVPGEAFGSPGYGRFSFALGDDDLGEGLSRIGDLLSEA